MRERQDCGRRVVVADVEYGGFLVRFMDGERAAVVRVGKPLLLLSRVRLGFSVGGLTSSVRVWAKHEENWGKLGRGERRGGYLSFILHWWAR